LSYWPLKSKINFIEQNQHAYYTHSQAAEFPPGVGAGANACAQVFFRKVHFAGKLVRNINGVLHAKYAQGKD